MAEGVLRALCAVDGVERVLVVTRERARRWTSPTRSAPRSSRRTSCAATAPPRRSGVRRALELGAERVLLAAGDCPLLTPADVDALLGAPRRPGRRDPRRPPRDRHQRPAADAARRDRRRRSGLGSRERHAELAHHRRRCRGRSSRSPPSPTTSTPPTTWPRRQMISAEAIAGLPEIGAGDDLAALLAPARRATATSSCSPTRSSRRPRAASSRSTTSRSPAQALALADEHGKDPRHIQVILDETAEIVRARPGVLICRTRHGFVCANAGVDTSNAPRRLPGPAAPRPRRQRPRAAPRRCPRAARSSIADSFGRAWRVGQADVAIGVAGLAPLDDWRGRTDRDGPRAAGDA